MPFAVLSFCASETLLLSRFVLSAPQDLKDYLEDALTAEESEAHDGAADNIEEDSTGEIQDDYYVSWNGNSCVLSKGYCLNVHELLSKIEDNGWKMDQFSTSLTGSGILCQTFVFSQQSQEEEGAS